VRPCYNIIEILDGSRVRVLRKEPYVDAEIVADYRDMNQPSCTWRSIDDGADRHAEEVGT
jgi:hypothetical protein